MAIVICYDGSESAKHAVAVAHKTLGHLPAILLHVWSPPAMLLADSFGTARNSARRVHGSARAGHAGPRRGDRA